MTLIDYECVLWDRGRTDVVRVQKINKLGFRASGLLGCNKANVISSGVGSGLEEVSFTSVREGKRIQLIYPLQNVEPVPFGCAKCACVGLDKLGERLKDGAAIGMFGDGAADNDHGLLGPLKLFGEWNLASDKVQYRLCRSANVLIAVSHVNGLTD